MNQLVVIALGGGFGAILRFLVSTGVYQWLGRDFPYGTLAVNIVGSFLIGLLTEALVLQRIEISMEYRAAILIGFLGSFTTFSTFSLETLYLLEQGNLSKAAFNIVISLSGCLLAVWLGLLAGRTLFMYSGGMIRWMGWVFPYALVTVNAMGAFLIGLIATTLMQKTMLSLEYQTTIVVLLVGLFITLTGLYLTLYLFENGFSVKANLNLMISLFAANTLICLLAVWTGLLIGKKL